MKIFWSLMLLLGLLFVGCNDDDSAVTNNSGNYLVQFADPKLEEAVRLQLNLPFGPIYSSMVDTLQSLNDAGVYPAVTGIYDLSGIGVMASLRVLDLGLQGLEDIGPLAELELLETLWLDDNNISDLSPLAGLGNLRSLWLWGNGITDLSPLENMEQLVSLDLGYGVRAYFVDGPDEGFTNSNRIADLSPLSRMHSLRYLTITGSDVESLEPLRGLTQLEELWMYGNRIQSISGIENISTLQYVQLSNNEITCLAPLMESEAVNHWGRVRLVGNPLDSISIHQYIPELEARGVDITFH